MNGVSERGAPPAPPAGMTDGASSLSVSAGPLQFRNPIVLAAGTAGYGRELEGVMDLDVIGGLVTIFFAIETKGRVLEELSP